MTKLDLEPNVRKALTFALGQMMSDICEECYCATWLARMPHGTEDELPALCYMAVNTGQEQRYGMGTITLVQANALITIAEALGHWADYGGRQSGNWYETEWVAYTPPWYEIRQWFGNDAMPRALETEHDTENEPPFGWQP